MTTTAVNLLELNFDPQGATNWYVLGEVRANPVTKELIVGNCHEPWIEDLEEFKQFIGI